MYVVLPQSFGGYFCWYLLYSAIEMHGMHKVSSHEKRVRTEKNPDNFFNLYHTCTLKCTRNRASLDIQSHALGGARSEA